jgi:parallel beta-helix repeat protein
MKRKWLTIGIILLFVGVTIAPAMAQTTGKQSLPRGNWLYVGGSGPGNYTRIQDAINDSSDGDTVFVYNGTYYEHVVISKTVNLIGEDKESTILDGQGTGSYDVVWVTTKGLTDDINISGFTIRHADRGLFISSDYSPDKIRNISIYDNIITLNDFGIFNYGCINSKIYKNIIMDNNEIGIQIGAGQNDSYTQNIIKNNSIGISSEGYSPQIIENNTIEDNENGIMLMVWSQNTIRYNNFINNEIDANIYTTAHGIPYHLSELIISRFFIPLLLKTKWHGNHWDGNYWDEWKKIAPRPIIGIVKLIITIPRGSDNYLNIPLGTYPNIKFDWHPAQEPYDIPGMR